MVIAKYLYIYFTYSKTINKETDCIFCSGKVVKTKKATVLSMKRQHRCVNTKRLFLLFILVLLSEKLFCSLQIFGGIYADSFHIGESHFYLKSILQPTQLL